jgi:hypothetical protein
MTNSEPQTIVLKMSSVSENGRRSRELWSTAGELWNYVTSSTTSKVRSLRKINSVRMLAINFVHSVHFLHLSTTSVISSRPTYMFRVQQMNLT